MGGRKEACDRLLVALHRAVGLAAESMAAGRPPSKIVLADRRGIRDSDLQMNAPRLAAALLLSLTVVVAAAAQSGSKDPQIQALEQSIAGREQLPAEQVFKNIRIFKGMPAVRVLRVMEQAFVPNLGVSCQHCHTDGDWASDQRPAKEVARAMWALRSRTQDEVRSATGNASAVVTCYTCHKGQPKPAFAPGK